MDEADGLFALVQAAAAAAPATPTAAVATPLPTTEEPNIPVDINDGAGSVSV